MNSATSKRYVDVDTNFYHHPPSQFDLVHCKQS